MNSPNWIRHALRRTGWQPQRQVAWFATVGAIIAIVIGALYLSQVASFATTNRELEELIAERDELERVNEQLRVEIASFQSVPRLTARAQEMGFTPAPAEMIEYLVVDGYNPHRSETVAPLENNEEPLPVYDETFLGWLQQQWDELVRQFSSFGNREG